MLISGVTLNIIALATGNAIPLSEVKIYTWGAIAFLVVVSSIIAFLAYLYALQKLPTALVSIYAYINPIIAVITGSIVIHEKITLLLVVGGSITLAGVYIVNSTLRKQHESAVEL